MPETPQVRQLKKTITEKQLKNKEDLDKEQDEEDSDQSLESRHGLIQNVSALVFEGYNDSTAKDSTKIVNNMEITDKETPKLKQGRNKIQ